MNRSLTGEVETLSEGADEGLGHLQLILEWWSEFNSNHDDDLAPWLTSMEERVAAVEADLESTVSPRPCPLSLQQTASVSLMLCWNNFNIYVHVCIQKRASRYHRDRINFQLHIHS